MKLLIAMALALLATAPVAASERAFDFQAFFTGRTHAENTLKVALKPAVKLVADSLGGKGDRGDFVLIDTVHEGDKPARTRKWIIRQDKQGNFSGSLSDATGPVEIIVGDDAATIRYTMKGGLKVEQKLQVQPGGKSLSNRVVVRKFGLKFARIDGIIRKLD